MKNKTIISGFLLMVIIGMAFADEGHDFTEGKELIESNADCDQLTEQQLEEIGEYLMEQMHQGERHGLMHQMMGLQEGTETEEQFHLNMAKRMYCNEGLGMMNNGMMGNTNMDSRMEGGNMMNYGMMNYKGEMMGSYGYWGFLNLLYVLLLIGLIIIVYLWIIKLWKSIKGKDSKK